MSVTINTAVAGGAGSGIAGGGGGDDPTDWGGFVGGLPTTVTVNGVTWTIGYTGSDITSYTVALTGAADLVVDVQYDNGYPEYSGNINVGGAVTMTTAQAKYLVSEVLSSVGAAAEGFRVRITDLCYTINTSNVQTYRDAVFEWDGVILRPDAGCFMETFYQTTHSSSSSESAALSTITMPGWLVQPGLELTCSHILRYSAGTSGNNRTRLKLNGVEDSNQSVSSTLASAHSHRQRYFPTGTATQFVLPTQHAEFSGYGKPSSGDIVAKTINTATTDFTFTVTGHTETATDKTITHYHTRVELRNGGD